MNDDRAKEAAFQAALDDYERQLHAELDAAANDCPGCGATDCTPATCPVNEEAWFRRHQETRNA